LSVVCVKKNKSEICYQPICNLTSRSKRSHDVSILKGSKLAGADMEGDYLIGPVGRNAISGLLLLIGPTIWAILD
jgi:hypothetical protein